MISIPFTVTNERTRLEAVKIDFGKTVYLYGFISIIISPNLHFLTQPPSIPLTGLYAVDECIEAAVSGVDSLNTPYVGQRTFP